MGFDILLRQPVAGNIVTDVTWSGEIEVRGDVIVERGATLTIEAGTVVRFAVGDERGTGFDPDRSELVIYGELGLPPAGEGVELVEFISAASRPRSNDWLGVFLMSGQAPEVEAVIDAGALRVANSRHGVVRPVLPPGRTGWGSGRRHVPLDLIVPAGAELLVEAGADLRFATQDLSLRGRSPELVELVVAGALVVGGGDGATAQLTTDSADPQQLWYGVRAQPGALVDLSFAEIGQCAIALSGEVSRGTVLRVADSRVKRAFTGLSLTLFGDLLVDRTEFESVSTNAVRVRGTGTARLRGVTIEGTGQEGVLSANCNVEAIDVRLEGNGVLDPEDPRAGLVASGGRGQRIELWRCTVTDNALHGLDLSAWEGVVELHRSEVSANKSAGIVASGLQLFVFEDNAVVRNLGRGAHIGATLVEVWTTEFEDNVGTGLVLDDGATGAIEMSLFRNGTGLELRGLRSMILRANRFENAGIGLDSDGSEPTIIMNRFENNLTALRVRGSRVPAEITGNAFVGNTRGIQNLSDRVLQAPGNYWGTTDSTAIVRQLEGEVAWTPFLNDKPGTVVDDSGQMTLPQRFAMHQSYPNPFNSTTVIPFDLPRAAFVELTIYDVLGQTVQRLVAQRMGAGYHRVTWDGRDARGRPASSGLYLCRFKADAFERSGRMLLLR